MTRWLLIAPTLVLAARLLDRAFTGFEVVVIALATVIACELIADGKSKVVEGSACAAMTRCSRSVSLVCLSDGTSAMGPSLVVTTKVMHERR